MNVRTGCTLKYALLAGASLIILAAAPGGAVAGDDLMVAQATAGTPVELPQVTVEAAPITTPEGRATDGYRVETLTNVGPYGSRKQQDTPFSMSVVPQEMMENLQATKPDDVFKVSPFIKSSWPESRSNPYRVFMRGFATNRQMEDGLTFEDYKIPLEDKERVEVLSGLSGFLFGSADPGGTVNYVLKRPAAAPLASVTAGNNGATGYYTHGDFGGPIGNGKLAYRLNVAAQGGETAVSDTDVTRRLVSGALDWRPTDTLLVQFNASHLYHKTEGGAPFWILAGTSAPSAPDADDSWGQKWGYNEVKTTKGGVKATYNATDFLTLRSAFAYIRSDQDDVYINNLVTGTSGSYLQFFGAAVDNELTTKSGYAFADVTFATGSIRHKVTFGVQAYSYHSRFPIDYSTYQSVPGSFSLVRPLQVAEPAFTLGTRPTVNFFQRGIRNLTIADDITINDSWSVLAGLTNARMVQEDWNVATGAKTTYSRSENTPSVSLVFKPVPWLTTYATYMEGLEPGGVVPNWTGAANVGQALPPSMSHQYEVGAKATVGGALLTVALFQIDKAFALTDPADNVYKQDGRQVHKGVELGVSGKLTRDLSLFGGLTVMDAAIKDNKANPALEGNDPADVSQTVAKLYAEYAVGPVPGLTLTGGVQYYSHFAADDANSFNLPAATVWDLGARYETAVYRTPLALRLNVTNLTSKDYWQTSHFTGEPRTITASATMKF